MAGIPGSPSGHKVGPYPSLEDQFDADSNGPSAVKIFSGTGTLSSGAVTITLPNGKYFSNTNYKVIAIPAGALVATADMLQDIVASKTVTSFVIKSTTSSSSLASATFTWIAIGN